MDAVLLLLLITLGFIYVVSNNIGLEDRHVCDYDCNTYDAPICASNEMCTIRFVGKCTMYMYNCLYPHKAFHQIEDSICGERWTAECSYAVSDQSN